MEIMFFMTTREKSNKLWIVELSNRVGIYLFKVKNKSTRKL